MSWRDVVELVPIVTEKLSIGGYEQKEGKKRPVFANRLSIGRSEFYQAYAVGIKPSIEFEVRFLEYNDEPILYHNGKKYYIVRAYSKNEETIHLICSIHSIEGATSG